VNASALALMVVVTLQLAISTLARLTILYVDVLAVTIAIASAILAIRLHINAAGLVLGGAAIGWIAFSLGYIR
jgi:chromate transporter